MPYKNKEQQREYQRQWTAKRRSEFFVGKTCKCGSTDQLELDHIDPSKKVSHRIWSWSEKRRLEELAKCQILCNSCHKKKSSEYSDSLIEHGSYRMRNKHGCTCDACKEFIRWRKQDWRERTGKN